MPAPETNPFGGKDAPHGVILKVVPTDICDPISTSSAPHHCSSGSVSRMLPESDLTPRQIAPTADGQRNISGPSTNIWLSATL